MIEAARLPDAEVRVDGHGSMRAPRTFDAQAACTTSLCVTCQCARPGRDTWRTIAATSRRETLVLRTCPGKVRLLSRLCQLSVRRGRNYINVAVRSCGRHTRDMSGDQRATCSVWHCGCDIQLRTSATAPRRDTPISDGRRSHLLGPRSALHLPPVYTGRFTIDRCPMPAKKVRRSARNADVKGSSAKMNASEEQRKGGRRRKLRSLDDIVKMPTDIMREVSSATVLGCSGTTDKRPSTTDHCLPLSTRHTPSLMGIEGVP